MSRGFKRSSKHILTYSFLLLIPHIQVAAGRPSTDIGTVFYPGSAYNFIEIRSYLKWNESRLCFERENLKVSISLKRVRQSNHPKSRINPPIFTSTVPDVFFFTE